MRTPLLSTLGRRLLALGMLTGLLALPACKAMPKAVVDLVAVRTQPAEVPPAPPAAEPPKSANSVQVLGVPKGKPVVGQPLPVVPRAGCEIQGGIPVPYLAASAWQPPGIKGPWPQDEFLHDGGDAYEPVGVSPEWRVQGLNVEDTVAHYDTIDGRTLVEPSNCAYVYAPRFSSVRSVVNASSSEFVDGPTKIRKPERVVNYEERTRVVTRTEQLQPIGQVANTKLTVYRRDQQSGVASTALLAHSFQQTFAPFEDLAVIRIGAMQSADKARLAERVESAIIWSKDDGVKVFIEKQSAKVVTGDKRAQAIYAVHEPVDGRLRICKIASTPAAQPGDFVDFTIRYDNVGDSPVGNIVILDSLTTRLAYEPDSAQSSRKAHFTTAHNAAESLELRWEIDEPLAPGDGGLVRFRCKVR
ncbi:MAG: hypothetical protein C0483_03300 [Pirellula sp.]|nr:hypothetical protein [Pirellula sp.]